MNKFQILFPWDSFQPSMVPCDEENMFVLLIVESISH